MLVALARRAVGLATTLLVSSLVIFAAAHAAPGSPLAALSGGRSLSAASTAALERRYHLDEPFAAQYRHWLTGVLHGDLGRSIALNAKVSSVVAERAGVTAQLVGLAAALIVVVGVLSGILAGLKPGVLDTAVVGATTALAALPSFVAAIALVSVFSVSLGWLPALGAGDGLAGRLEHLMLPALALSLSSVAVVARVTRVSVRAELGQEHVQTAISRGLPPRLVLGRHVLRNAAVPITTVVGITVASLLALSAVVERAFSLNGLGSALVQAAASKDLPVVQAIALLLVALFVLVNTAVDLLCARLDPRLAHEATR